MLYANFMAVCFIELALFPMEVFHYGNRDFVGDRAFSVAAFKVWNSLPTDLKTATCLTDAFKRRLKTWLFKSAYD